MSRGQEETGALADPIRSPFDQALVTTRRVVIAVAGTVVLAVCWTAAEVRPASLFSQETFNSVWNFSHGLFPPDFSPAFLRIVFSAATTTILIAVAGTLLSVLIGLPLGVLSTPTLWRRGVLIEGEPKNLFSFLLVGLCRITRALLGFLRAVPDLVWGLLFVVAVGLGSFAGALALAVSYGGVLGRVYADVFEDVDSRPLESLRSTGATRAQIFFRGIWPQAAPSAIAYSLYSFECCVRAASVLGFVGAGGIGYEINLSMRLFEYRQVMTLILTFVVLLAATDATSRYLRRRFHANAASTRLTWSPWGFLREHGESSPLRRLLGIVRMVSLAVVAVLIVLGIRSSTDLPSVDISGIAGRMTRFIGSMFPPDIAIEFLRSLGKPILQTIGISVIGTLIGIAFGAVLALPSTSTLMLVEHDAAGRRSISDRILRLGIYSFARLITNTLRSIPELVWTLICIIAIGLGPFAGTLSIGLHTAGVLGKLYAETIEEAPPWPIEALRASGARTMQIMMWGIWPQARPTIISYTILRWEMNLRVSTILGLVGGGGLGQAIYNNVQLGFYPRVATLVVVIYSLVLTSDWIGDRLRVSVARG